MNIIDREVGLGRGRAMAELQPVEVLVQPTCPDVIEHRMSALRS